MQKLHPLSLIIKIFFRLLYREFAWSYDLVAWSVSLGLWKTWILEPIPYILGTRILELGHGPGHLQAALRKAGYHSIGLDLSPQMGRLAKQNLFQNLKNKYPTNGYAHFVDLVCGNGQALPFGQNSFDTIIATFPTEYITSDQSLSEIHRVLVPGGRLILVLSAWITGQKFYEKGVAYLVHLTGQSPYWQPDWGDVFTKFGFRVEIDQKLLPTSQVLLVIADK